MKGSSPPILNSLPGADCSKPRTKPVMEGVNFTLGLPFFPFFGLGLLNKGIPNKGGKGIPPMGTGPGEGLGLGLGDGLGDGDGLGEGLGDKLGEGDRLGLRLGEGEGLGLRLGLGEGEGERLGLWEAEGTILPLGLGDKEPMKLLTGLGEGLIPSPPFGGLKGLLPIMFILLPEEGLPIIIDLAPLRLLRLPLGIGSNKAGAIKAELTALGDATAEEDSPPVTPSNIFCWGANAFVPNFAIAILLLFAIKPESFAASVPESCVDKPFEITKKSPTSFNRLMASGPIVPSGW